MFDFLKRRRRAELNSTPFPSDWRAIIARNLAYASLLTGDEKNKLEELVRIFVAEKHFEGCGGLILTDEIRVTIAAQACLLIVHVDDDIFPTLETILVYPSAYRAPATHSLGSAVVNSDEARLGESSSRGVIVLAWDHVVSGARHVDGHNVVLHEFAHQLDAEDGDMDGAPDLGARGRYAVWAEVLGPEYEAVVSATDAGRRTDIDSYGATNPVEFFAVVTEMFFEKPAQLARRHPDLYEQLRLFYGHDPAAAIACLRDRDPKTDSSNR